MTAAVRTGFAAGLAMAVVLVSGCRRAAPHDPQAPAQAATAPTPIPGRLVLFFPGDDALLHREVREVPDLPATTPSRIRLVVDELRAGSREGRASVYPWPATLEAVFVDRFGAAYLDLAPPPAGAVQGTAGEVALVYATINSLVANCPGVERVQLLFGGHEVETLGHLNLSRPLAPAPALVAP